MRKIFTLSALFLALGAQAQVIVDEYETYDEDSRDLYRFVVSYKENKERASETVYRKHKEYDGTWTKEERVDRGIYTYEYDSKGRLTRKEVKYEEEFLDSYYIEITYGANETIYKQYEDGSLRKMWGTFPTGEQSLATMSEYDSRPDFYARYNKNGFITERGRYDKYWDEFSPFAIYNESGLEMKKQSNSRNKYFRYNTDGKVVEYIELGHDDIRQLVTYDNLGRILKIESFELDADNEWAGPVDEKIPNTRIAPRREYQKPLDDDISDLDWALEEVLEYTYANDEVYDVTNGWYSEFGFCGPVATMNSKDYDDGELDEEISIAITRDASGKITGMTYLNSDSDALPEFTFDSDGHITSMKMHEEYDYEEPIWGDNGEWTDKYQTVHKTYDQTTEYTWRGDNLVKATETSSYYDSRYPEDAHSRTETRTYTYDNNKVTCTNDTEYDQYVHSLDVSDGRIKQIYKKSWGDDDYFIVEKQTENVNFQLRRPFTETPELGLDSIKVISQAGRVIHAGGTEYTDEDCINVTDFVQGQLFRSNCSLDDYFHVKKENGQFYCYDYKDRITYVVKGNLLMKEYDYNVALDISNRDDIGFGVGGGGTRAQVLNPTPTEACYIREYSYDAYGNLLGVSTSERDKDGNITTDYSVTYTYDPESVGIQSISTSRGFHLNGRNLGVNDGMTFSLYDLNGRPVATSVNDFTFDAPGTYIMKTGNKAVKISVN